MRLRMLAVVLFLPIGLVQAQDAPKKLEGDLAKVQGTWTGQVGPEKNIPVTLVFKDNNATLTVTTPEGQELQLKGEFKLDEKSAPKQWDWSKFTRPDGEPIGDNKAIYELKGDELKICSGGPDQPRPTEFKDGEGGQPNVTTWTRKKEEAKEKP